MSDQRQIYPTAARPVWNEFPKLWSLVGSPTMAKIENIPSNMNILGFPVSLSCSVSSGGIEGNGAQH
jgi:hypothetical protein